MKVFTGSNPTQLYWDSVNYLNEYGEKFAPRGKEIKELRPVTFEFTNPLNRLTFLKGRRINPFFQLAEALWIIGGKSDVAFLDAFNSNMKSFSDDGVYFNASYGERIRYFTKNDLSNFVLSPIDQLKDAYLKLKSDPDTRQAVVVISNPMFDNYGYTNIRQGKDQACNLVITFKLRNKSLDMTVFNRSNDVHWGLFGANLVQFSTIQEIMATWLGAGVGTYYHVTDSFHMYLDSYGNTITGDILKANYEEFVNQPTSSLVFPNPEFLTEPRMSLSYEETDRMLSGVFNELVPLIMTDSIITTKYEELIKLVNDNRETLGDYWHMTVMAMIIYRMVRLDMLHVALLGIRDVIPASQWAVSMLHFLKNRVSKSRNDRQFYQEIVSWIAPLSGDEEFVFDYLKLEG